MSAKIYQGEDRTLKCFLKNEEGNAYDLTGVTEITAKFVGTSATVEVTLADGDIAVVSPAGGGELTITLSDTNTALLKKGITSFEVLVDKGTERRIVQFLQALEVVQSLF